jgi:hypothetical protein
MGDEERDSCAGVAQLVEQRFCKPRVGGSIPLAGPNIEGRPMDIDEEIRKLEEIVNCVPGTIIQRVLTSDGVGWSLGLGCLNEPKKYYNAGTIKECLEMAQKDWGE